MGLKTGDKVPDFVVKDDKGEDFHSQRIIGKTPVVIYFYPKNFTPGCIKEACDFRDSYMDFKALGAEVIGVSADSATSHEKFKRRYQLPFTFLSDKRGSLRRLFGVKSELLGLLPGRETYVIDKEGIVRLVFNSIHARRHMEKAISKLKEITSE